MSTALAESESTKRRRVLLATVRQELGACDEGTLLAVQKLVKSTGELEDGAVLPRGVAKLGGSGSTSIPRYLKSRVLIQLTGANQGVLNKIAFEDFDQLFLFGICKSKEHPAPCKRMGHKAFVQWCVTEYEKFGKVLSNVEMAAQSFDWTREVGCVQLCKSGAKLFDSVRCKMTGEVKSLPRGLQISESDVDEGVWKLRNNTCLDDVELVNVQQGETHKVGKRFSQKVLGSSSCGSSSGSTTQESAASCAGQEGGSKPKVNTPKGGLQVVPKPLQELVQKVVEEMADSGKGASPSDVVGSPQKLKKPAETEAKEDQKDGEDGLPEVPAGGAEPAFDLAA